MAINNILGRDTRNTLNNVKEIHQLAKTSEELSKQAKAESSQSLATSDITQKQLNQAIKDGNPIEETQQARVNGATGEVYDLLVERLDGDFEYAEARRQETIQNVQKISDEVGTLPYNTFSISVWEEIEKRGINVEWFGAKGDNATDSSAGFQLAYDWAYANGVGNIHAPKGTYVISKPLYHWSPTDNNFPGILLQGDQQENTIIRKANHVRTPDDGSPFANIDAVIVAAPRDLKSTVISSAKIMNIRLDGYISESDFTDYGFFSPVWIDKVHLDTMYIRGKIAVQFKSNVWDSSFKNLKLRCIEKGFSMLASGTSNLLENVYVYGAPTVSGFELRGIYSFGYNLEVDRCSGKAYDFQFASWHLAGIGCEKSDDATHMVFAHQSVVVITNPGLFGSINANSVQVYSGQDSIVKLIGGRIGDPNNAGRTSPGALYQTSANSSIEFDRVLITDKYAKQPTSNDPKNNVIFKNDYSTEIALQSGTTQAYIGHDRSQGPIDLHQTSSKIGTKAIFLSAGISPLEDSKGNDYRFAPAANLGDVFIFDDPKKMGAFGTVTIGESGNGYRSGNSFSKIPIIMSGTTAERPIVGLQQGQEYRDNTLGTKIYYTSGGVWRKYGTDEQV
jgi:hypothetical protein